MREYMKNFISKGNILLSIFCGIFFLFPVLLVVCIVPQYSLYAILFSVLFTLSLMIIMPITMIYDEKKYADIDKIIEDEILIKEKVNINCSGTLRNGYFILTKDRAYLFSRDKKPFIQVIFPKESVMGISVTSHTNLNLLISETVFYSLVSRNCEHIFLTLQKYGWIPE